MKKRPILQVGGPAPAPPTPPVIRVVFLHTEPAVQDLCPDTERNCSEISAVRKPDLKCV